MRKYIKINLIEKGQTDQVHVQLHSILIIEVLIVNKLYSVEKKKRLSQLNY